MHQSFLVAVHGLYFIRLIFDFLCGKPACKTLYIECVTRQHSSSENQTCAFKQIRTLFNGESTTQSFPSCLSSWTNFFFFKYKKCHCIARNWLHCDCRTPLCSSNRNLLIFLLNLMIMINILFLSENFSDIAHTLYIEIILKNIDDQNSISLSFWGLHCSLQFCRISFFFCRNMKISEKGEEKNHDLPAK